VLCFFNILQLWRGWSAGIARMTVEIGAIIAGIFLGRSFCDFFAPLIRPLFNAPDLLLSPIGAVLGGFLLFLACAVFAKILLKKTADQGGILKLGYGLGGMFLALIECLVFLLIFATGIRIAGTLASLEKKHPDWMSGVIELHQMIERTPLRYVLDTIDPISQERYRMIGKIAKVATSSHKVDRFLSFPGAKELISHPKLLPVFEDPEVRKSLQNHDFHSLLSNRRVIDAFNDPDVRSKLKSFPLDKALDYALAES